MKVNPVTTVLFLASTTKQLSHWLTVPRNAPNSILCMALGGQNEEFLIHGRWSIFEGVRIDFEAGALEADICHRYQARNPRSGE